MGLTIHYEYAAKFGQSNEVVGELERMRALGADLPFIGIGEIRPIPAVDISAHRLIKDPRDPDRLLVIESMGGYAFCVNVGSGSESLDLGFARYPRSMDVDDHRILTGLSDWSWQGFCKTQYASNPKYGGVVNFLQCHISVVTLLERIEERLNLCMNIQDEGQWGRSNYSDDWREASAAGRKPTYTWHKPQHDPEALVREVADWNETIAGLVGALNDALGNELRGTAPIRDFPDFEHLEAKANRKGGDHDAPATR